eukprot:g73439.t1
MQTRPGQQPSVQNLKAFTFDIHTTCTNRILPFRRLGPQVRLCHVTHSPILQDRHFALTKPAAATMIYNKKITRMKSGIYHPSSCELPTRKLAL